MRSKRAVKQDWEMLFADDDPFREGLARLRVPGGWLLARGIEAGGFLRLLGDAAPTFYPDPEHRWDGGSLG